MDELFGRRCFVTSIAWRISDNSNNNALSFSEDNNHILVYSKNGTWRPHFLNDLGRRTHFRNPDNDPRGPWFDGNPVNNPGLRPNLQFNLTAPNGNVINHPPNGWRWSKETIEDKLKTGELRFSDDGTRLIRRTYLNELGGLPPSNLWIDLDETGHTRQAKYELKSLFPDRRVTDLFSTPKPEKLIKRILELATGPGDLVLDSFLGSGTTAAVAHKMRRRWIGIELGEHCQSHCIPRLKKVVDGEDLGGITRAVEWNGGGGFRYYRLGPSLIIEDEWGNPVINPVFNAAMLAEAMCKLEGFQFDPNAEVYWQQGRSSESDFIYVTTQTMTKEMLTTLSDDVGLKRSLLICCSAFRCNVEQFENLTVKKIPKAVLRKCEWGHDDYSLEIKNLTAPPPAESALPADEADHSTLKKARKPARKFGKGKDRGQTLFDMSETARKGAEK
jgi:adenine-specific DNA-methyltransferase